MEASEEVIRTKLKQQLEQSGMTSVVRRMVHQICNDQEDLNEVNLDEVVNEVYKRGVMKNFMENLGQQRGNRGNMGRCKIVDDKRDISDTDEILLKHSSLNAQDYEDSSESDIINEELRKSGKYYLKMQIVGGKAFLDYLLGESAESVPDDTAAAASLSPSRAAAHLGYLGDDSRSKLVLHVFYKSQRFTTKPVLSCCDPDFKETFLIEIGRFEALDGSIANELLNINEPLRIVVVREDVNHVLGGLPVAYCRHDWRTILIKENGFKLFSLELMGIGPEHSICVGILRVRFTLIPLPHERISESTYLDRANEDGAIQEDFERLIITVAKRWWKEFIEIRPDHQFRLVRLFAYDENMVARPLMMFIRNVLVDDLLVTPFQAAWFVALLPTTKCNNITIFSEEHNDTKEGKKSPKILPGIQNGTGGCALSERWQNIETTLSAKCGTVEDHATLLASLFLSFGLDAYIALGTKRGKGSWAWTVTLSENKEPTFWESTTGEHYEHYSFPNTTGSYDRYSPEKVKILANNKAYGFLTISCLFNRKGLYANVQPTTSVDNADWNLENPSKWKYLSYSSQQLCSVSDYPIRLHGSILNWDFITKKLDFQLKNLLASVRKERKRDTKWNDQLARYMGQHLHREEMDVSTGGSNFKDYFRTVALNMLPVGYEFRAHTFHSRTTEAHLLFSKALGEPLANDIIFPQGDCVQHSLKVTVFPYPEDVLSIRFMIACMYIPV